MAGYKGVENSTDIVNLALEKIIPHHVLLHSLSRGRLLTVGTLNEGEKKVTKSFFLCDE